MAPRGTLYNRLNAHYWWDRDAARSDDIVAGVRWVHRPLVPPPPVGKRRPRVNTHLRLAITTLVRRRIRDVDVEADIPPAGSIYTTVPQPLPGVGGLSGVARKSSNNPIMDFPARKLVEPTIPIRLSPACPVFIFIALIYFCTQVQIGVLFVNAI